MDIVPKVAMVIGIGAVIIIAIYILVRVIVQHDRLATFAVKGIIGAICGLVIGILSSFILTSLISTTASEEVNIFGMAVLIWVSVGMILAQVFVKTSD